jgi:hypothetical protein
LNKARDTYYAELQKGKEIGLDEAAQAEPVRRSEKDTHDIQGTETVHAIVPKRSVDPKCIPKPFIRGALCDTSVDDVTMVKERISFNSFPNICRGASFLSVAGVQWMESATCERGSCIRTLTKTAHRYSLGDSLLAAVMMIDMNGHSHLIFTLELVK